MSASVKDQNGFSEITKSFLPQIHRTEEASIKRTRRFVGAVAAIGAGAGLILGDSIKDAACTALSIFNMCNDNSPLSQNIEAAVDTQQQIFLILQRMQAKNDDNFFLLNNEVKETQHNVKQIRGQVNEHLQTLDARIRTIKIELLAYKECRRVKMVHLRFLLEIGIFFRTCVLSILTSNLNRKRFMPTRSTCSLQFNLSWVAKLHLNFLYQMQLRTSWLNSLTMKSVVVQNVTSHSTLVWSYLLRNKCRIGSNTPPSRHFTCGRNSHEIQVFYVRRVSRYTTERRQQNCVVVPASEALFGSVNGQLPFCRAW